MFRIINEEVNYTIEMERMPKGGMENVPNQLEHFILDKENDSMGIEWDFEALNSLSKKGTKESYQYFARLSIDVIS